MKTFVLLLAVLSLHTATADRRADCVAECRTKLLQASEGDCAYWRGELPRPDLYNHCQHGHRHGREASCASVCSANHHERRLDSQRLDACAQFKSRPPNERVTSCNQGFVKARTRALEIAEDYHFDRDDEPVAQKETVTAKKPDSQREDRKLAGMGSSKQKSVLEAAREEAAAAFQDAKASEL